MELVALPTDDEHWNVAAAAEAAKPGNLFPSHVASNAVGGDEHFLRVLEATAKSGYPARRFELVAVPKLDRATRPAADIPLEDQVLYTAIVENLRAQVHPGLVQFTGPEDQSYADFEAFPVNQADTRWVLEADVASFYEYVDHEILGYELVGLTGLSDLVEGLLDLLQAWMGAGRGLPQGPFASAPLADIYIAPVSRALMRAGFEHSRYSDDFRIPARTWPNLRDAQIALESALRSVGLVLSAGKLRTPKIDVYRKSLDAVQTSPLGFSQQMLDLILGGEYAFDEEEITAVSNEVLRAAERILEDARDNSVDVLNTRLLRWALPRLGRAESNKALTVDLFPILWRYAHVTQTICLYLKELMGTEHEKDAISTIKRWFKYSFKYPWQIGWMLHATAFADETDSDIAEAAFGYLFDDAIPWFARGQAAIALAVHGDLPKHPDYFSVFERSPEATKPDLLAAVLIGEPRWRNTFVNGAKTTALMDAVSRLAPDDYEDWL